MKMNKIQNLCRYVVSTFGPINLVSTDGHQVNIQFIYIKRNLANCLCSISMEEDFIFAAKGTCQEEK